MLVSCLCLPALPVCDRFTPKDTRDMREAEISNVTKPSCFLDAVFAFESDHRLCGWERSQNVSDMSIRMNATQSLFLIYGGTVGVFSHERSHKGNDNSYPSMLL